MVEEFHSQKVGLKVNTKEIWVMFDHQLARWRVITRTDTLEIVKYTYLGERITATKPTKQSERK